MFSVGLSSIVHKGYFDLSAHLPVVTMVELKFCWPSQLLLILLLTSATLVRSMVSINLTNLSNTTASYKDYLYYDPLNDNSFSTDFDMTGFLYQPKDSCTTIPPIPNSFNSTWFAVIKDTNCFNDAVENVKDAGFVLIIVAFNLSAPRVKQYDFPIVVISTDYLDYLVETALSDFSNPAVLASVTAINNFFIGVMLIFASIAFMIILISIITVCVSCCVRNECCISLARFNTTRYDYRESSTDLDVSTELALNNSLRQGLTESTSSIQRPLGYEQINQLPSKQYKKRSSPESCTVCLDVFRDGDEVRVLPCGHNTFHTRCLDSWLASRNRSCPLCRHNVTKMKLKVQESLSNDEDGDEMGSDVPLVSGRQEQNYSSTSASAV